MRPSAIHQFHPGLAVGDGVTNGMFYAQRLLRALGFASEIFCERAPDELRDAVRLLPELPRDADMVLLVHHSLGYPGAAWMEALPCQKILVYHNITPPEFLPPDSEIGRYAALGREQLKEWPDVFAGALGDSEYNSAELREAGFSKVTTLPLLVDTDALRAAPWDAAPAAQFRDAWNLLFVGRVCENKRQLALVEMLAELRKISRQPVRLILAGATTSADYQQEVAQRIAALGLQDWVHLAGKVPAATLAGFYRNADAFVSMSVHEGFGMPLIEAMLFDVPVIAHAAASIPDTLGEGGVLVHEDSPRAMAEAVLRMLDEPGLRRHCIAAQRRNLQRFDPALLLHGLASCLQGLGIEVPQPPAAPCEDVPAPYWQIEGPFDSTYSLAVVNRELARALDQRGNTVGLRSMEGQGDFAPSVAFLAQDAAIAGLALRAQAHKGPPDAALRFCYPPHVNDMPAALRAVHTYGWEESGFPRAYADAFNRRLDLITVLSQEVAKILRDNGVRVPMAVVGAGVDHLMDVAPQAPAELAAQPLRTFRFLHVSSCFPRKGVDALLRAYGDAFRDSDDVTLVIKTFPNPHNDVARQLAAARHFDPGFPHVVLIDRDCSDAEMAGLYTACHAFVAPSRGEGFGLPMAEAMLYELPVITTAWGGQTDFCTDEAAWLCDFHFTPALTHLAEGQSVWADPDTFHLAALLREVHGLTPEQKRPRTERARDRIRQDYTWARVAERTEAAIAAVTRQPAERNKPLIGWVSTWNKRCGIAGYSHFLTQAIPPGRMVVLADRVDERTAPDEDFVQRVWNLDLDEPLDDLYDAIRAAGVGAVVIQYNFGFFSLKSLGRLVERLKAAGTGVHVFFHATGDLLQRGELTSLSQCSASLAQADRLYVHTVGDLNRFKRFGLARNTVLFAQGVMPTPAPAAPGQGRRTTLGLDGKKVMATYGFLLPHKGLQQIVEAFALMAPQDPDLHLLMVNALYPIPESSTERDACLALAAQHGLADRVTLISDFLPEAECLALLQAADVVVFPYQRTQESSSAAVRVGLASGVPVAVTPLAIFEDVAEAVHFLPGMKPQELADGLRDFFASPAAIAAQRERLRGWSAARQWPLLSQRLLNIIEGIANPLESHAW